MKRRTYTEQQLCILCLACLEGVGPRTIHALARAAAQRAMPLPDALTLSQRELTAELGVSPVVAPLLASIRSPALRGEEVLGQLDGLGARPAFEGEALYPERLSHELGELAPPVLFLLGEAELLQGACVSVSGSREPSRAAAEAARSFATEQAASGTAVVSGAAAGIDSIAHRAALQAGATVVVPPVGLARSSWRRAMGQDAEPGRWCAVGQFPPRSGWQNAHALMRNHTIAALGAAVVGFDPRDRGGTWHTCRTTLGLRKPLFVVSGAEDPATRRGLKKLVRAGARALSADRVPNAEEFRQLVTEYQSPAHPAQSPLFLDERDDPEP